MGGTATATATISVSAANDAPIAMNDGPYSVTENEPLSIQVPGVLTNDTDVEGDTLTAVLDSGPDHGALTLDPQGSFRYVPTSGYSGFDTFSYRTNDGRLASSLATVTLFVVGPPVFDPIGNKTIGELNTLSFVAAAHKSGAPGALLNYSLVDAPPGASIDSTTGRFSWVPTELQGPGSYDVTLRVSDGGLKGEVSFLVDVTEVNEAPVLAPIGGRTIGENTLLTFTASASDPDLPIQSLTFSLVNPPAGAIIGASTGAFAWTPTEAQGPAVYNLRVRVSDGLVEAEQWVSVNVGEVNSPPSLYAVENRTINELAALSFGVAGTDLDVPTTSLAYSLIEAPAGASINSTSGLFAWTPTETQGPGSYTLKVRRPTAGPRPSSTSVRSASPSTR